MTSVAPARPLPAALIFITFVGAIISSLGAPLIPEIATSTHTPLGAAQWTLTITLLVAVIATPVLGRLADGRHRRATICLALGLVVVGAAVAAIGAHSFAALLFGRALQGFGQGLAPMMIAVAHDALPPQRSRSTISVLSITNAAGVGIGYPLTGLLAQFGGVAAAFWFGAVVATVALLTALVVLPRTRPLNNNSIDVGGAALFGLTIAALLLGLAQGGEWGWSSWPTLGLLACVLLFGGAWYVQQRRVTHPLVNLRVLRVPTVLTADCAVLLAGIGMYLLLSVTTRVVQAPQDHGGLGATAAAAGLAMLPLSAGSFAATFIARWLGQRLAPARIIPTAAAVMLIAMTLFGATRHAYVGVLLSLGIAGIGIGLIFAATPALIVGQVPAAETGAAMSLNQIFRYVGYSIGSVLSATILTAMTPPHALVPLDAGYTFATLAGASVWVVVGVLTFLTSARPAAPRTA